MSEVWKSETAVAHAECVVRSYLRVTGRELLPSSTGGQDLARRLFYAPFVVVSHGTETDPILNYGNLVALRLWAMPWSEFVCTPSRFTAEPPNREERARLLETARRRGFIEDYSGVRIAKTGERFRIERAVVWNLQDEQGRARGQAATFAEWTPVGG
jgi:hypothetical protein